MSISTSPLLGPPHRQPHVLGYAAHFPFQPSTVQPFTQADAVHFGLSNNPPASCDVVIIGGGLAGMTAAWLSQTDPKFKLGKVVLLEEKPQVGGNSKNGKTEPEGMVYQRGATSYTPGDTWELKMLEKLGIHVHDPRYQFHEEPVYIDTPAGPRWVSTQIKRNQAPYLPRRKPNRWTRFRRKLEEFCSRLTGRANRREQQQFEKLFARSIAWVNHKLAKLLRVEMVTPAQAVKTKTLRLDRHTFEDVLERQLHRLPFLSETPFGSLLQRAVRHFYRTVVRSDLNSELHEVSALSAAMDLVENTQPRYLFPGGLQFIIDKMFAQVQQANNSQFHLQTQAKVTRILPERNRVQIEFTDGDGKSRTLTANQVLLGTPAPRIPDLMPSLAASKAELLRNLKRGEYVLMNLFLKDNAPLPIQPGTFSTFGGRWVADLGITHNGGADAKRGDKVGKAVITCYMPLTQQLLEENPWLKEPDGMQRMAQEAIEELDQAVPGLSNWIKGAPQINHYEGLMSAAPGQWKKLHDLDPQLEARVRWIHSESLGLPVATGAIQAARQAVEHLAKNGNVKNLGVA